MFTLGDVLSTTGARLLSGRSQATFSGVAIDSRNTAPGDLFVAFRGDQQDGHHFVTDALNRGAAGALVEGVLADEPWASRDWAGASIVFTDDTGKALAALAADWRLRHAVRVVGVTGSVGKTTAKEVTAAVLSQKFTVLRSLANLNTDLGMAISIMGLQSDHQVAVLEMAMHDVGEIARLAELALPEVGIITNVLPTHLERLGTIERIAEAKGELVRALPREGLALLNADDPRVRAMASDCLGRALLYGTAPDADLRASDIRGLGLEGMECTVEYDSDRRQVRLQLLGRHAIYPALSALGAALHLGMAFDDALDALSHVEHGPRLLVVPGRHGTTIIDDSYNASPASTLAALDLLQQLPPRRLAVLGDMLELGPYEEEGHRAVGRRVAEAADWLLAVGARADIIADEAQQAGMERNAIERFSGTADLIRRLEIGLRPGDTVLVKASHGMRLDAVVDAFRATGEQQPASPEAMFKH